MRSFSIPTLFAALAAFATLFLSVRGEVPLDLGLAGSYAILAGSTITSTGTVGTVITGNMGVFPGSAVTGFPPAVLNGAITIYGASGSAQGDLTTAYNVLAGKAFTSTLSNQDLGGMTLIPGVYKFDATATLNGILTLDALGDSTAVWTFQIGSSFMVGGGSSIIFKNSIGAADYVYWQVGTTATIATGVPMLGNILALQAIILNDGVTVQGRCLARNGQVTLDRTVITVPSTLPFSAKQTLTGISLKKYNQNPLLNTGTLKTSIAMTMTGVSASNIQEFKVTADKSTKSESTSSVFLNYVVAVSSSLTTQELQAQLNTAVQDGTFDQYLHQTATTNNANDLKAASSKTVTTRSLAGDENSTNKDTLSDGAIAGIVIGGFLGLVLIGAILFFFCYHGASSSAATQKSTSVPAQEV